eukprot:CAMPEP_0172329396 /NCGR_PEP_ID=MMETSP1058-20130122/60858_1 /TAXON_ID=83371 /ORGANISM="Detonula confervacea, Strain CCMP 353" /LENGTH=574 /DNA_ID=CAMNT_0013046567 /DNA_START=418 /DNA_END=2142 /DNA_ORIENTATION=-
MTSLSVSAAEEFESEDGRLASDAHDDDMDEFVDRFLHDYKNWTTYNNILARLDSPTVDPSHQIDRIDTPNDNDVNPMIEYVKDLLTCEEENGDAALLPTFNEWTEAKEQSQYCENDHDHDAHNTKNLKASISKGCTSKQNLEKQDTTPNEKDTTPNEKKNLKAPVVSGEPSSSMSLDQLSEMLLRPGMKFQGHICVPGFVGISQIDEEDDEILDGITSDTNNNDDNNDSVGDGESSDNSNNGSTNPSPSRESSEEESREMGKTYELVVMERGKDALGHAYLLATHVAYGDEQCVNIRLNIREVDITEGQQNGEGGGCSESLKGHQSTTRRLEVEYADGETCCFGSWNPTKFRLEGHVRQMLQANDGVFHTSDAVTHVFTLYPCTGCFPVGRKGGAAIDEASILAKLEDGLVAAGTTSDQHSSLSLYEKDILSRDTRAVVAHWQQTYPRALCTTSENEDHHQHYPTSYQRKGRPAFCNTRRNVIIPGATVDYLFLCVFVNLSSLFLTLGVSSLLSLVGMGVLTKRAGAVNHTICRVGRRSKDKLARTERENYCVSSKTRERRMQYDMRERRRGGG